jgi:hypothetical protein
MSKHKYNRLLWQDTSKRCNGCGQVRPLSWFYADKTTYSGRKSRCKLCVSAKALEWYYQKRKEAGRAA